MIIPIEFKEQKTRCGTLEDESIIIQKKHNQIKKQILLLTR